MALIVQAGDPVLRRRAAPVAVEKFGTPELRGLVDEMIATMRAAPGVGLAAPQIGVPLQILVAEDSSPPKSEGDEGDDRAREPLPLTVVLNPELTVVGEERATFFEGCLSVSGWTALVTRALEVEVRGFSAAGEPLRLHLHGWPARILQHEVDHLNGTLYIDRMFSRSFSKNDAAQRLWSSRQVPDVAAALGIELG